MFEVEPTKDVAIEGLQRQIDDIVQELNLLKEQQALQTGTRHIWSFQTSFKFYCLMQERWTLFQDANFRRRDITVHCMSLKSPSMVNRRFSMQPNNIDA